MNCSPGCKMKVTRKFKHNVIWPLLRSHILIYSTVMFQSEGGGGYCRSSLLREIVYPRVSKYSRNASPKPPTCLVLHADVKLAGSSADVPATAERDGEIMILTMFVSQTLTQIQILHTDSDTTN